MELPLTFLRSDGGAYHMLPRPYQYYQQVDARKASILYANWETPPHMYAINLNHEVPDLRRSCESIYERQPILPWLPQLSSPTRSAPFVPARILSDNNSVQAFIYLWCYQSIVSMPLATINEGRRVEDECPKHVQWHSSSLYIISLLLPVLDPVLTIGALPRCSK